MWKTTKAFKLWKLLSIFSLICYYFTSNFIYCDKMSSNLTGCKLRCSSGNENLSIFYFRVETSYLKANYALCVLSYHRND